MVSFYLTNYPIEFDPMNSRHPGKDSAESQEASNESCDSDGGIQSEILCRVLSWQGLADSQIHALSKLTLEGTPVEVFNIRDGTSIASNWLPVFEYMEWSTPYSREPLADKASYVSHGVYSLLDW